MRYIQITTEQEAGALEERVKAWWQKVGTRMGYSYDAHEVSVRKDIPLKLREPFALISPKAYRFVFKYKQGKTGRALHFSGYSHTSAPWETLTQLLLIVYKMQRFTRVHEGQGIDGEPVTFTLDTLAEFSTSFGFDQYDYGYRVVRAMRDGYGRIVDDVTMLFGKEFIESMESVNADS